MYSRLLFLLQAARLVIPEIVDGSLYHLWLYPIIKLGAIQDRILVLTPEPHLEVKCFLSQANDDEFNTLQWGCELLPQRRFMQTKS